MAVKMVEARVCDFDDEMATQTITFRAPDGRNLQLDVCDSTMRELVRKAHTPRRGRKPGSKNTARSSGKATARKTARKTARRTTKKVTARKRTGRRKATS